MTTLVFGSGNLYGVSANTGSTPRKFGAIQDVSFDFSYTLKELFSQNSIAMDARRGEGKFTGKAKFANINGLLLNELFFNQTTTTGQLLSSVNEAGTVPGATTYTVTVANATNFSQDLGVVYANGGAAFVKVASGPTVGQYSVSNAGVYTFAAADANAQVLIDYLYTSTTGGSIITMSQQMMGVTPYFMGFFTSNVGGKIITLKLNNCTSSKLSMATKTEDYTIPEMDFTIIADASNNIGTLSIPN